MKTTKNKQKIMNNFKLKNIFFAFIFIFALFFISINISNAASVSIVPVCNNLTCDFIVNVSGISAPIGVNLNYEGVDFIYSDQEVNTTKSYTYSKEGTYNVKVVIYKDGANVATSSINVNVTSSTGSSANPTITNISTGTIDTVTNTNLKTDVLDKLPLGTSKGPDTIDKKIEIFLDIVNWIFVVATGIGVLMIIISGISYMLAGGDETRAQKATKTLLYSAIGVAIALTSSFIIQIIKNFLIS